MNKRIYFYGIVESDGFIHPGFMGKKEIRLSVINIGPLAIHLYAIMIMLKVVAGSFLAQKEANRRGQNGALVWDLLVWVLIAGIIGARIWHILTPSLSAIA